MRRKIIVWLLILSAVIVLSACGTKRRPVDDGRYHYKNVDLGFTVVFPPEFEHYQTWRKAGNGYIDIEFFVPTGDTDYPVNVPGYAMPLKARIFTAKDWDKILENQADGLLYRVMGHKSGRVYTLKFWRKIPDDWRTKWSKAVEEKIAQSFKIL